MVLSEQRFNQLLADYSEWKISQLGNLATFDQNLARVISAYEQRKPFVILSPVPNGDWDKLGLNPFALEEHFRLAFELKAEMPFFVINNHDNFHWDCYQKNPGVDRKKFDSSGAGNSCAAYTMLNIIKRIPSAANSLIVKDSLREVGIDSLEDVNQLSSVEVRAFLFNLVEKQKFILSRNVLLDVDQSLKRISQDGVMLESEDLKLGLTAAGINCFEATDFREQHGDILENVRRNIFGLAEVNPQLSKQREIDELFQYLASRRDIDAASVGEYLDQLSSSKDVPSSRPKESVPRVKENFYTIKDYGFLGNSEGIKSSDILTDKLSRFIVVDPSSTAFVGSDGPLFGIGAADALYQKIADKEGKVPRPTYQYQYNQTTECPDTSGKNSDDRVKNLKIGEAVWNDVYNSTDADKPYGIIHAFGPSAPKLEEKAQFKESLTDTLANIFLHYHYATKDLEKSAKPGLRIPLISSTVFSDSISKDYYYPIFKEAFEDGYQKAKVKLRIDEIDFGSQGVEICCFGAEEKTKLELVMKSTEHKKVRFAAPTDEKTKVGEEGAVEDKPVTKLSKTDDKKGPETKANSPTYLGSQYQSVEQFRQDFKLPKANFTNDGGIMKYSSEEKFRQYVNYEAIDFSSTSPRFGGFFEVAGGYKAVVYENNQAIGVDLTEGRARSVIAKINSAGKNFVDEIKSIKIVKSAGNDYQMVWNNQLLISGLKPTSLPSNSFRPVGSRQISPADQITSGK